MSSLKRQRTSFEPDGRGQKRACSNHLPNFVQNERATRFQNYTNPATQASTVVPKRCIHKIVTACNLSQAICCACADTRPENFNYKRYMDGRTWNFTGFRWDYYCSGCEEYWDTRASLGYRHREPLGMPEAKDVPNVIRVVSDAGDVDITRSVDLTLDSLKAEVARRMQCNPRQLMASDIAMHKGRAVPEMSEDNALALCATYIRVRCDRSVGSGDEEMEDVQYDQA
ncbi:hypothetical protein M3J09_004442 [Ascochyta lentis]